MSKIFPYSYMCSELQEKQMLFQCDSRCSFYSEFTILCLLECVVLDIFFLIYVILRISCDHSANKMTISANKYIYLGIEHLFDLLKQSIKIYMEIAKVPYLRWKTALSFIGTVLYFF